MHDQDDKDFSRRDFFKTLGVGAVATASVSLTPEEAAARQALAGVGPGEVPITLTINGRRHQLQVEPRVTLLDAMRTRLDITARSASAIGAPAARAR